MAKLKILGAVIGAMVWFFFILMVIISAVEEKIFLVIFEWFLILAIGNFLAFLLIVIDWLNEYKADIATAETAEVVVPTLQVISQSKTLSRAQDPNSLNLKVIKCPQCGYNSHNKRKSCKVCLEPFT